MSQALTSPEGWSKSSRSGGQQGNCVEIKAIEVNQPGNTA